MSDKKQWRVVGVMGTEVLPTAEAMQHAMNQIDSEGYDVKPVLPYGGHFIVIGERRKGKKGKPAPTKAPGPR